MCTSILLRLLKKGDLGDTDVRFIYNLMKMKTLNSKLMSSQILKRNAIGYRRIIIPAVPMQPNMTRKEHKNITNLSGFGEILFN